MVPWATLLRLRPQLCCLTVQRKGLRTTRSLQSRRSLTSRLQWRVLRILLPWPRARAPSPLGAAGALLRSHRGVVPHAPLLGDAARVPQFPWSTLAGAGRNILGLGGAGATQGRAPTAGFSWRREGCYSHHSIRVMARGRNILTAQSRPLLAGAITFSSFVTTTYQSVSTSSHANESTVDPSVRVSRARPAAS